MSGTSRRERSNLFTCIDCFFMLNLLHKICEHGFYILVGHFQPNGQAPCGIVRHRVPMAQEPPHSLAHHLTRLPTGTRQSRSRVRDPQIPHWRTWKLLSDKVFTEFSSPYGAYGWRKYRTWLGMAEPGVPEHQRDGSRSATRRSRRPMVVLELADCCRTGYVRLTVECARTDK